MFYEMNMNKLSATGNWPSGMAHIDAYIIPGNRRVNIPVTRDNILITGKTRSGKTTFTKAYIKPLILEKDEPYSVFFDIKDDFREYIRPQDKVIMFSETVIPGGNYFKWNMIREIRKSEDWEAELDELTGILFEDLLDDSRNRIWVDGARVVFKGYIKTILYCHKNSPSNGRVISGMRFMSHSQFINHLAKYRPNYSLLKDYFEYDPERNGNYKFPKKAGDIMFFLQNVLAKFGGTYNSEDGEDTIFDFLNDAYGRRLFMIYDYKKRESSSLFFRYFLKKIIDERLAQNVDRSKKVLMVLDEIAELEHDFGLMQALTIGQGNYLQIIVCTQSLEKMYCIAPDRHTDHITNASLAGFRTHATFLPGDPQTVEIMQKLYGNRRKEMMTMPLSRYGQPISTLVTEPMITEEAFAGLGTGECYIKIREAEPVHVKIALN